MKRALGIVLFVTALMPVKLTAQAQSKATKSVQAKPASSSKAAGARNTSRKRGRYARHAPAPSYQQHPDPERYRQIQQALTERGYFKGEVNGRWGEDSVDALKRFQADQKLDNDGKIDALTLIGLGLGPKHDGSTAPVSSVVPPANAPEDAVASH
jgi:peptidoglycan hydrolase-like protein with peptidoglycan-binding domain